MTYNRLADEPSPYLVQHKDNPVHWYPWGEEAFAAARETGKPILLSVGYAACHWCHVMAHESFEDPQTAAVMNDLFINIKLDREERPDIDKIYMEALHHLGEQGGWPLTMFLTPEREPFWGGTYFPKTAQYGRLGFTDVLNHVARAYRDEPEKVSNNAAALTQALNQTARADTTQALSIDLLNQAAQRMHGLIDMNLGGLKGAPKFPQPQIFEFLWRHYIRSGDETSKAAVLTSITNICQGGIYDHLGGGFARYSVDERWLAPHFEKMLYDNAQLLKLLVLVWQDAGQDLFRQRIEETITWVSREMIAEHMAFSASLDADSEGVEGKFYVWNKAEITALLGTQSEDFCALYDVTEAGNWEGHTILNRLGQTDAASADPFLSARVKLLDARAKRIRPGTDDKILTDWNGLMISALAQCAIVFGVENWSKMARKAYEGVKSALWSDSGFSQSHRNGQTRHRATSDGYANMIEAALSLYELTGDTAYIDDAETWLKTLDQHFWNEADGGYFFTHDNATDVLRRTLSAYDDAVPNANATMLKNLSRLYTLTGNENYRIRGDAILAHFNPEALANIVAHAGFANGFEDFTELLQAVIIGNDKTAKALKQELLSNSIPTRHLTQHIDGDNLPMQHPAKAKAKSGETALYLCKGQTCSLPITEVSAITTALRAFHQQPQST